jgi:hypothetical protein
VYSKDHLFFPQIIRGIKRTCIVTWTNLWTHLSYRGEVQHKKAEQQPWLELDKYELRLSWDPSGPAVWWDLEKFTLHLQFTAK